MDKSDKSKNIEIIGKAIKLVKKPKNKDKTARAPVARTKTVTTKPPRQMYTENGDCIITHREYLGDVVAGTGTPTAFTTSSFAINPAQSSTFPWLSAIASRFESYVFEKLEFMYETEAPSSLGGSLILTVDYDASDPAPLTKQTAMTYRNAVRSAPWEPCRHTSASKDLHKAKTYYVRPSAQPTGTDIKTYDVGNLFVCTQNVTTASSVCGELYVSYRVRLMTPVYEQGIIGALAFNTNGTALTNTSIYAGFNPVGGLAATAVGNALTVTGLVVGQEYVYASIIMGTVMSALAIAATNSTQNSKSIVLNTAATSYAIYYTFTATSNTTVITTTMTATTVTNNQGSMAQIPLSVGN